MKKAVSFNGLMTAARAAGLAAANAMTPTPMIVTEHENPLNDASPIKKSYYVPSGVCGFAWIVVKPGISSFARWLVKEGIAHKHYYGGVAIWVSDFGQSMERKEAYAHAFAKVLSDAGYKAWAESRMD